MAKARARRRARRDVFMRPSLEEKTRMATSQSRFEAAIAAMDAANAEDSNVAVSEGQEHPKELLYAQQMTRWLERLVPDASEALKLAARSQHIRRWEIARGDYPKDRIGYLKWRKDLQHFHAELAGKILAEAGYDDDTIARVQSLLRKERLKLDPEVQALEDVICLVFLEHYFADFSTQHDEEKVVEIVRKTWKKMSPEGHQAALALKLPPEASALVEKALADQQTA
ncbi:MAG: DUF4202 domain-containing protein [Alphaproteobacteria bacterium]